MRTLVLKLLAVSSLFICLALAPHAAYANYGALYLPAIAPNPSLDPFAEPESFLDGLKPGKTYVVQVSLTNVGTTPWTIAGPNSFHLAYHWDGPAPLYEGERTDLPYDVLPGDKVTVQATLKTPATPGTYTLQWDMVQEGIAWFSNQGVPTENQIVGIGGKVGADQGRAGQTLYEAERCKWDECSGVEIRSCATPQIELGPSYLQQDSSLWISGCGFGAGTLYLVLPASNNLMVPLEIDDFYDKLITARVPADLVAPDQQAFLRVVKYGGQSNDWPVDFKTLTEVVLLDPADVKVVHCSDDADYNYCNNVSWVDQNICCVFDSEGQAIPLVSFATIQSFHETDGSAWGDSGVDMYQVVLKNGWKLHKMSFNKQITNSGSGTVKDPAGFAAGQSSATIAVEWSVGGNSGAAYFIDLYAVGPKGTQP
jgi:hypothetical protein